MYGDRRVDLAVLHYSNSTVGISLAFGNVSFAQQIVILGSGNSHYLAVGDFNGDHRQDLVITINIQNVVGILLGNGLTSGNCGSGTISIFIGNGGGTFQSQMGYRFRGYSYSAAIVDINGDNTMDIIVTGSSSVYIGIYLDYGNGTFVWPVYFITSGYPEDLAISDFNNDGRLDVATSQFAGAVDISINVY
ncbi:unnamed protein product [Rotaria magnacalcarata]|uniref:VCBS repeat-containing protein n=1 Tax=Rotaria magnacalcarata TaxID=392030 RepID=A0A8S2NBY0_9BILA|nr:unnamed protein product [Rotaria magnacalcarata]